MPHSDVPHVAQLHIDDFPGREPATVWLHHGAGSASAWAAFLPAAAGGRRAIAYDRNGFGGSPHARVLSAAMFDEDADELLDVVAALNSAPVHLVGHSDGGTVALLAAARRPDLVLSVAVIAVHVRGDEDTVAALRRMGPPSAWPAALRRSLRGSHGDDWLQVSGGWYRLWISPAFTRWSIVDDLQRICCPVLVVHDRSDALSPPLHAQTIAASIPEAQVHWVDSGTHYPHRADRQRFVDVLQAFWDRVEEVSLRCRIASTG